MIKKYSGFLIDKNAKGTKMTCNAEMCPTEVRDFCQTDTSGEKLLKAAVQYRSGVGILSGKMKKP
jgi:hypothetical protein